MERDIVDVCILGSGFWEISGIYLRY